MSTAQIEVPASRGNPYTVTRDDHGVVRLRRQTIGGNTITTVFSRQDVINVVNAMVDILEAPQ